MNNIINQHQKDKVMVGEINNILKKYGINETIKNGMSDIVITDTSVSDFSLIGQPLSNIITEYVWKKESSKSLYHFTKPVIAEKILNSKSFRLYSLSRRCGEGELESFIKVHNWEWMFKQDEDGSPSYETNLMNKLYYSSFTDLDFTEDQKSYFKTNFGEVRLKFKVIAKSNTDSNFRKIWYPENPNSQVPLLDEIKECIESHNKIFIFTHMPRLSAFYLPNEFSVENEYRILFRDLSAGDNRIKYDEEVGYSYIEIPINSEDYHFNYKLILEEVSYNGELDIPDYVNFKKLDWSE